MPISFSGKHPRFNQGGTEIQSNVIIIGVCVAGSFSATIRIAGNARCRWYCGVPV